MHGESGRISHAYTCPWRPFPERLNRVDGIDEQQTAAGL